MVQEQQSDPAEPQRVFISYSQEPDENRQRVRQLANSLRAHGVDAWIDDYEPHPEVTWQEWMKQQINESDLVLLVCSERYLQRARGEEEDAGRGVRYEAKLITEAIYAVHQQNTRFVPIVFSKSEAQYILQDLSGWSFYVLGEGPWDPRHEGGYHDLYRRITQQPKIIPPLGQQIELSRDRGAVPSTRQRPDSTQIGAVVELPCERADKDPSDADSQAQKSHAAEGPLILIGESAPDPNAGRGQSQIEMFLVEEGFQVCRTDLYFSGKDPSTEFPALLRDAAAFVQVIGERRFPDSKAHPEGYELWQVAEARRHHLPSICWQPLASVSAGDDSQEAPEDGFVRSITEEFKSHLRDWLKKELSGGDDDSDDVESLPLLLIHHHQADENVAAEIGAKSMEVAEWLQPCVCGDEESLSESIEKDPVSGLVVVYADADEDWVLGQLDASWRASRRMALRLKRKPPKRAVYMVDPDDSKSLRRRPADCLLLRARDEGRLEKFLDSVSSREEAQR